MGVHAPAEASPRVPKPRGATLLRPSSIAPISPPNSLRQELGRAIKSPYRYLCPNPTHTNSLVQSCPHKYIYSALPNSSPDPAEQDPKLGPARFIPSGLSPQSSLAPGPLSHWLERSCGGASTFWARSRQHQSQADLPEPLMTVHAGRGTSELRLPSDNTKYESLRQYEIPR